VLAIVVCFAGFCSPLPVDAVALAGCWSEILPIGARCHPPGVEWWCSTALLLAALVVEKLENRKWG